MILTIDPSLRGCGCALWDCSKLVRAGYAPSSPNAITEAARVASVANGILYWAREDWDGPTNVICEIPQTYGGRAAKGDANDLILLACAVGSIIALNGDASEFVRPHDWKGSAPKAVTEARAREKLSAQELACVDLPRDKRRRGDVWDAIGIGLWYLKR